MTNSNLFYSCPKCRSEHIYQREDDREEPRMWYCPDCKHSFFEPTINMIMKNRLDKYLNRNSDE